MPANELTAEQVDEAVARDVMGWRNDGAYWVDANGEQKQWSPTHPRATLGYEDVVWSPSTSISAAWQVVEKMRADGWHFALTSPGLDPEKPGVWCIGFARDRDGERNGVAYVATVPRGICESALAALRAAGGEGEGK
jgi:hypothetical protein